MAEGEQAAETDATMTEAEQAPMLDMKEDLPEVRTNAGHVPNNNTAKEKEEESLLPSSENNLHKEDFTEKPPKDRYLAVYFILILHGIGTLMPWNMFITANEYFVQYKLKTDFCGPDQWNATQNGTDATVTEMMEFATKLYTNTTTVPSCSTETNIYQDYFLSVLGFVAQVPNVLFNGINVFAQCRGGSTSVRIIWSIIIIIVMFILTVVLAMIDTSDYVEAFFWVTMVCVVIINVANGVYQNSIYGTAAFLPMKYTNAVVLGSNVSGTLASSIMLLTMLLTPNIKVSAIYYFITAIFVLIIAFDTYFALPFFRFYRHYRDQAQEELKVQTSQTSLQHTRPPYGYIFKKCWKQFLGVWLVFFVTLTCFPAIQANVKKTDFDYFPLPDDYFTAVTCFLFFNFFAMIGNLFTEWFRKPGPRWVLLPIVLRLFFIPFFVMCNFWPTSGERGLPVLIPSNWVYVCGGILMALTSGYFSSLTMMYAPREMKEPEYKGVAGMMAAFFLILGIFSGVLFSLPVTIAVENMNFYSPSPYYSP